MEAIVCVGIQGSGKTSFYRERFFDTHIRINLDMLRTRHREQLIFAACLQAGQSFVIDNTNPLPADRARYVAPARHAGFRIIGYLFESSLADALRRNSQRSWKQRIPVPGVASAFRRLIAPTFQEGFDAIYTVTISAASVFLVTPVPNAETS